MRLALVVAAVALQTAASVAQAAGTDAAPEFDTPLAVKHVDIGPAETVPPQEKEVRCSYFPTFMVKEVDEREVGAAQLSILPSSSAQPAPCQRDNLPGERVVDDKVWTGYFAGAHGETVIFSAEDGVHGGMGFAVVRPADAKVIYSSAAKGNIRFAAAPDGATVLQFEQIYAGDCSVAVKGGACAARIGHAAQVAAPDVALCRQGYAAAKRAGAVDWCAANAPKAKDCVEKHMKDMADWDASPSVISVRVAVVLGAGGAVTQPSGPPNACWPSE
jgi:hypothetical protein